MNPSGLLPGIAMLIGFAAASVGILAVLSAPSMRLRIEGGVCVAVGVACLVAAS
jgi:uncharacterized protein YjeT (DUF2065 family)